MSRVVKEFKPATRKDVAQLAKVALSTVSVVLNNTPNVRVSQATRERIERAAKELNYRPSKVAASLKLGKTGNIGIVIHYVEKPFNTYLNSILEGIWAGAMEKGYKLLFAGSQPEQPAAGLFCDKSVDGVIIINPPYKSNDSEYNMLLKSNMPTVLVGAFTKGLNRKYVGIDDYKAGYTATQRLIEKGHKRILHFTGPVESNSSAILRLQGYKDALKDAGIAVNSKLIQSGEYDMTRAEVKTDELLKSSLNFSAVFAGNYPMALGVYTSLKKKGLKIPEDISMFTIDDPPPFLEEGALFSHISQPNVRIGELAISKVLGQDSSNKGSRVAEFVSHKLVEEGSIAGLS